MYCVLKMAQGVVVVVPAIVGLGAALPKKDRSAPKILPLAVVMNASLSRANTRSLTQANWLILGGLFSCPSFYFIP